MLNFGLSWWKLVEHSGKQFIESVEHIFINKVMIGEINDGRYDKCVESFQPFFNPLTSPVHRLFQKILNMSIMS